MQDHRRTHWWVLAALVLPLLLATAYLTRARRVGKAHARAPARLIAPASGGSFLVDYGEAQSEELVEWRSRLREDRVLERVAQRLNDFVRLPSDVDLAFEECGDDDAYYERGRVTFCYEEVADYADLLAPSRADGPVPDLATRRAEEAAAFFLYHEAGHALVDLLELPVTGKEEDAVDQFAVYLLQESGPPDARVDVLQAADVLGLLARADARRGRPLAVWDVHSLDGQRRANLLCWVYGADPRTFGSVVRRAGLPGERRSSCTDEYDLLAESWGRLLASDLVGRTAPRVAEGASPRASRP